MSDIGFQFSPMGLIGIAYLLTLPVLAGLVMLVRALTSKGMDRNFAGVGLVLLVMLAIDLAFLLRPDDPEPRQAARATMLLGAVMAWGATAARTRQWRWMDLAVLVLPAVAGLALVALEHG